MMQNVLQPGQAEGHHGHHGGGKKDQRPTADQMTEIASKTDDSDLASPTQNQTLKPLTPTATER